MKTPEEKAAAKAKRDERKRFVEAERERWRQENLARQAAQKHAAEQQAEVDEAERLERLRPQTLRIVNRGLIDVLAWHPSRRGRNWVAVVEADPSLPGGIERKFLPRAAGKDIKVVVPDTLSVGDILEFGGDHVSYSARRTPNRVYAVVLALSDVEMVVKPYETVVDAQLHKNVRIA